MAKYLTGIKIDLKGPNGNVFYLFGLANRLAKELALSPEEYAQIKQELYQASTYEAHLDLLRNWFGVVFIGK